MKTRGFYPYVVALLAGLSLAQIIATIQVHWSNNDLYRSLEALGNAGYLLVPNEIIMTGLKDWTTAFYGGIFFSLTVGAGLTLAGIGAFWMWDRFFQRRRVALFAIVLLWCAGIAAVNENGWSIFGTLYFAAIPPFVFSVSLLKMQLRQEAGKLWAEIIFFVPLLILALLWAPRLGAQSFTDIRDNLLFSSSTGIKVAEGYYKYTLYPAYSFKSLDQRLLKTCRIEGFGSPSIMRKLKKALLKYDYLPLADETQRVDLRLAVKGKEALVFSHDEELVFQQSLGTFLASPGNVLKEYSRRLDRNRFLRTATYWSLLIASPFGFYMLIFSFFYLSLRTFSGVLASSVIASSACLMVGLLFFGLSFSSDAAGTSDIEKFLKSPLSKERIQALRAIEDRGIEIDSFENFTKLLGSHNVPERHWLARALAYSRSKKTYRMLISCLDDSDLIVEYVAYSALGRRGGADAIQEIIRRIPHSKHWYSQLYAYRALRALGWMQKSP